MILGVIGLLGTAGLDAPQVLASPGCTGAPTAPAAPAAAPRPRPAWLERLINRLGSEPVGNPPQSVWLYRYKGRLVYYIPPQCCDQYSVLFDAEGSVIGAPDGGITGRGDGRAGDFQALRTEGRLIWSDPRSRTTP